MMPRILTKLYQATISNVDKIVPNSLQPIWQHPAGPRTVFFWAPMFKWGIVISGFNDITRPPEMLSLNQTIVLASTGFIWCRYAMVIIPKNYVMFSVNLVMGITQVWQIMRIYNYKMEQKSVEQ